MTRPASHRQSVRSRALFAIFLAVAPVSTAVPFQASAEDADSLLGSVMGLAQVEQGCKVNAPWASQALCREAAEAVRRQFTGVGVPYTPHHVVAFPTHPRETLSAPGKLRRKLGPKAPASRPSRTEVRP